MIRSIFGLRCPRCREGKLFKQPYKLSHSFSMPPNCPTCGVDFHREPGFYFGAMFITYALSSWAFFFIGLIMTFGFGLDFNTALIVILIVAVLTFVYVFRVARSMWIHVFVKYDPACVNQHS